MKHKQVKKERRRQDKNKLQNSKSKTVQGRIDPYRARGRAGGGGLGGGPCLPSQNTEPRGEPLMAERDMSTFRMVAQRQRDSRHTCQTTEFRMRRVLNRFTGPGCQMVTHIAGPSFAGPAGAIPPGNEMCVGNSRS